MANADATTEQDRHLQSPAAHILHLPNLVDDFSGTIEHEIRKHEIDNRPEWVEIPVAGALALLDGQITLFEI